jgi:hypothetical protein
MESLDGMHQYRQTIKQQKLFGNGCLHSLTASSRHDNNVVICH